MSSKTYNLGLTVDQYRERKHLLKLRERYFQVFEFRNGLTDGKVHTLKETGKRFGISSARVYQLEARVWHEIGIRNSK